jgi:hypothetical protein
MSDQTIVKQAMLDCGLNAWAMELLAESLLRHPDPKSVEFFFPVRRKDTPGWIGVKVRLEPIAADSNPAEAPP